MFAAALNDTQALAVGNAASILRFADSSKQGWTGALAVWDWSGTATLGGGVDQLIFGANTMSLTVAQLAEITFYSDAGATRVTGATGYASLTGGEVVPGGLFPSTAVPSRRKLRSQAAGSPLRLAL